MIYNKKYITSGISFLLLLLLLGSLSTGCLTRVPRTSSSSLSDSNPESGWVKTVGTISESAMMTDGSYAYTLEYNVTKGTAKNSEGEFIEGLLTQHFFGLKRRALEGQKLELRYNKEEPAFFELLDDIVFLEK